jgi:hypothetical protein
MVEQPLELKLKMQTEEPSLLVDVFGTEMPAKGTETSLAPGVSIRADHVEVQHGFVGTSIVINCILQAASGIATKVIADLLLDRFRERKAKLSINGKPVPNLTRPALESALDGAKDAPE